MQTANLDSQLHVCAVRKLVQCNWIAKLNLYILYVHPKWPRLRQVDRAKDKLKKNSFNRAIPLSTYTQRICNRLQCLVCKYCKLDYSHQQA